MPFSLKLASFNFYPRSPRGERPGNDYCHYPRQIISIHAPRVGSDMTDGSICFDSSISIHAPRVGSDSSTQCRL